MHGVTTALVGFLLVCVVFPNLVKNRPQYYVAFALVCVILILDALGMAISGSEKVAGFRVFAYVIGASLQVGAMVLLFAACGGLTLRELADDVKGAFEVIRRGGEQKEIIIPLSEEMERLKAQREAHARETPRDPRPSVVDPQPRDRIVINDPTPGDAIKPDEQRGSIPLEP